MADPSPAVSARVLKQLESGDAGGVNGLLGGVGTTDAAHAFVDLLDGSARPSELLGMFVAACGESMLESAEKRRGVGLTKPTASSQIPVERVVRRSHIVRAFDVIPAGSRTDLLVYSFSAASPAVRRRAAERLVRASRADGQAAARALVRGALEKLGAADLVDQARTVEDLHTALDAELAEAVAAARAKGAGWKEIGHVFGMSAGSAGRRFRR
jgi:hypothetical protein